MKKLVLITLALAAFLWNISPACADDAKDMEGITKALNLYTEAAVKGDSKIAEPAFAPKATMSYAEKGKLVTVPISELFAYYDKTGPHNATYKIETVKVAGDVAVVSIDSKFGDTSFDDMFTLVKDGDDWKIVSKVYHIK
ncbi:MAG: nuclear transport factor 2 family protein [Desulfovibrio sp.]|uniref:nuclear transport factor 2 family protein n=1 Tax=Desulfovibrio sp. TaxID=885 RepID=UPI001A6C37ED|nr:nuclear transport factor 2 family protein [Desulfovibrio sp.]MBD5418074.1 nuclear transport factor 2 family protein [Desulfovibrio sp.]